MVFEHALEMQSRPDYHPVEASSGGESGASGSNRMPEISQIAAGEIQGKHSNLTSPNDSIGSRQ